VFVLVFVVVDADVNCCPSVLMEKSREKSSFRKKCGSFCLKVGDESSFGM
jgi:hypothetical protein